MFDKKAFITICFIEALICGTVFVVPVLLLSMIPNLIIKILAIAIWTFLGGSGMCICSIIFDSDKEPWRNIVKHEDYDKMIDLCKDLGSF